MKNLMKQYEENRQIELIMSGKLKTFTDLIEYNIFNITSSFVDDYVLSMFKEYPFLACQSKHHGKIVIDTSKILYICDINQKTMILRMYSMPNVIEIVNSFGIHGFNNKESAELFLEVAEYV